VNHRAIEYVGLVDHADSFEFVGGELEHLIIRHGPQVVAFLAEILQSEPDLVGSRD
jgi:hypothetical protein